MTPIINKKKSKIILRFTKEDDLKIYSLVREHGRNWKLISDFFEGKTPS